MPKTIPTAAALILAATLAAPAAAQAPNPASRCDTALAAGSDTTAKVRAIALACGNDFKDFAPTAQTRLETAASEIAALKAQVAALQSALTDPDGPVQTLRGEVATLQTGAATVASEISDLKTSLASDTADLRASISTEIGDLRRELVVTTPEGQPIPGPAGDPLTASDALTLILSRSWEAFSAPQRQVNTPYRNEELFPIEVSVTTGRSSSDRAGCVVQLFVSDRRELSGAVQVAYMDNYNPSHSKRCFATTTVLPGQYYTVTMRPYGTRMPDAEILHWAELR